MGLEAAVYIDDLNASWPLGTDLRSSADNHLRLIKAVLQGQFTSLGTATAVVCTAVELNLLSGYTGVIPELGTAREWTAAQNFNMTSLTDAATIAWDLDVAQVCSVTLTANRTLGAPTNMKAGGTYIVIVRQDGSGGHTLAFNSAYKWSSGVTPVVASGASDVSILSFVSDGTNMFGSYTLDAS